MVGSVAIEELELPFVCVSADLRTGQPVVHRSGPLWEHIRSSLSLPLISPPRLQGKQILVDGGLVSNLPVEPLAAMGEGPVIGVAVRMTADPNQRRSAPQGGAPRLPQIGEILMRTMVLSSATADREAARQATFMIMPATPGIGFFDFDQFDRAVEAGREAARQALAAAAASGAAAGLRPSVAVPADGVDQMLPR
jgi:NTE family protein